MMLRKLIAYTLWSASGIFAFVAFSSMYHPTSRPVLVPEDGLGWVIAMIVCVGAGFFANATAKK